MIRYSEAGLQPAHNRPASRGCIRMRDDDIIMSLNSLILERIAAKTPSLRAYCGNLRVLSREFTGVGSYTNFKCQDKDAKSVELRIGLDDLIVMPNVQNGMGAVLLCQGDQPKCLETYTFGDQLWDGNFEGFIIEAAD
jgi:hypothetical protein